MENYIINSNTLILIPINLGKTRVYEKFYTFIISKSVFDIVEESCLFYGSSFKGRCKATEKIIGVKYKSPIIVSEKKELVFFPTKSFMHDECIWVNVDAIEGFYYDQKSTNITLINKKKITLNITSNIFNNQYFRASRLKGVLRSKNR